MMDRERQEKDLQEVFETTQGDYRAAVENTFALQERTLEFARSMLEAPPETLREQAENNRVTLKALAEQSRRQREAMENLMGRLPRSTRACLAPPTPITNTILSLRRLRRRPKSTDERVASHAPKSITATDLEGLDALEGDRPVPGLRE